MLADDYCCRGWSPIPVPFRSKNPGFDDWQHLRITTATVSDHFNGEPQNIGVLLGEPSNGLVDIDLDCREAVALADVLLPPTGSIFGRAGKPSSHRLYLCPGAARTMQFSDPEKHPQGQRLAELRSTGAQTILPGSTHESGEAVLWESDDDPATVDADTLVRGVRRVAAGSLIARRWGEGSRHTAAMALSACLIRGGWALEGVERFVEAVARAAGDEEVGDRVRTVRDTATKLGNGGKCSGWPTLAEVVGDKVANRVAEWLGIDTSIPLNIRTAVNATEEESAPAPSFVPVRQLIRQHPKLRDPVVFGLLRVGETANIVTSSKGNKSWLIGSLGVSVVAGRLWLGRFQVRQSDVLILDNELHRETLAFRIPQIASALGITTNEYADGLYVESLRGRLRDIFKMESYFAAIQPGKFGLIVLDSLYRFLPAGKEVENDNGAMAQVYNFLDRHADRLGCAFVLIHHTSKGLQTGKAITDVGAGAGAQSRAVDSHVVLRPHEEDDVVVMDAAVRSWPPLDPLCLRWTFPIWTPDETLDPTLLRKETRRKPKPAEEQPATVWTVDTFVSRFIADKPQVKAAIMVAAEGEDITNRRAGQLLEAAEAAGRVHRWKLRRNQPVQFATIPQPITASEANHE